MATGLICNLILSHSIILRFMKNLAKENTSLFSVNLLAVKNVARKTLVNYQVCGKENTGHENAQYCYISVLFR